MLQQADDFAPLGQIMRKRAVEVEETQQVGEPAAVAEEAYEAAAVGRIGIKAAIDFLHGLPPGTQGFGGEAGEVAVLLPPFQHLENMLRLAAEQGFVAHGDEVVYLEVLFVQIQHHARQRRGNAPAQHRQQDAAQLLHGFHRAVERVHQPLAAHLFAFIGVAQRVGHLRLQVETQLLLRLAGGQVQLDADTRQAAVAAAQHGRFGAGEDALAGETVQLRRNALHPRQPEHGVDIAQAAGAGFQVRLQAAARLCFQVPLLQFQQFAFDKGRQVALHVQIAAQAGKQFLAAVEQAGFEERGVAG